MDEKDFNNYLYEVYQDFQVTDLFFNASQILKNCDPIAYDQAYNNWCDSMDRERTENDQK